jgi:hypothetical protein
VNPHGERFDQAGIAQRKGARERNERSSWDPHSLSHTAVDGVAQEPGQARATKMRRAAQALIAFATVVLGFDRHRRSVVEHARNLVAERAGEEALVQHMEIATADAR